MSSTGLHRNPDKEEIEMIRAARRKKRAMKAKRNAKRGNKYRKLTPRKIYNADLHKYLDASQMQNYENLMHWLNEEFKVSDSAELANEPEESENDSDRTLNPDEVEGILAARKKRAKKAGVDFSEFDKPEMPKEQPNANSDGSLDLDEVGAILDGDKENDKNHSKKAEIAKENRKNARMAKLQTTRRTHAISDSDSDFEDFCKGASSSKSNAGSEDKNTDNRPVCKYGDNCYRKNPDHFRSYAHKRSTDERNLASTSQGSSPKMKKVDGMTKNFLGTSVTEFSFFLTSVKGIPQKFNNTIAYGIKDLLSLSNSKLKASAQFNYMFDIPWLVEQYPPEFRNCPLTIVHGEQLKAKQSLENTAARYPNIKFCQAKLDIPFGTHHTKMMFLLYENSLRIVIHTSNIVNGDWAQKTQGMWVSPLFPRLKKPSLTEGESVTGFKADIIEYVSAYRSVNLEEWCLALKQHDLSEAKVVVIGSVPGRHIGSKKTSFGHLKLRKVLNKSGPTSDVVSNQWPIVGQFSSIGSLGASADQWMCGEWQTSLATIKGKSSLMQSSSLKLVYPSVENVRKSLEGYPAGASLPYSIKVASKQPYLKSYLHQWKSEQLGRSEASPHIKSYFRLSPSSEKIAWFLVTSANLSKAAWGALEKKDSQLMIRSFEIGVLFLPEYFGKQSFDVLKETKEKDSTPFLVPFDLPLSKYNEKDEPWIWDIPHVYAPDRNGNKWCPQ